MIFGSVLAIKIHHHEFMMPRFEFSGWRYPILELVYLIGGNKIL